MVCNDSSIKTHTLEIWVDKYNMSSLSHQIQLTIPMLRLLLSKAQVYARTFDNHKKPVMLVFIW